MICLAVTYVLKPGTEDEAVRLFGLLTPATRAEPGCRMYLAHRSADDPRRFFLYEQYDSPEDLEYHRSSPHFTEYVTNGLFHLIETRTPELYIPLEE